MYVEQYCDARHRSHHVSIHVVITHYFIMQADVCYVTLTVVHPLDTIRCSTVSFNTTQSCNCKKSRCLKLYCECFQRKERCGSICNCVNCLNTAATEDVSTI
jgi:Tesmin/TSO1-like CXC domain, cysteine-rich domain